MSTVVSVNAISATSARLPLGQCYGPWDGHASSGCLPGPRRSSVLETGRRRADALAAADSSPAPDVIRFSGAIRRPLRAVPWEPAPVAPCADAAVAAGGLGCSGCPDAIEAFAIFLPPTIDAAVPRLCG